MHGRMNESMDRLEDRRNITWRHWSMSIAFDQGAQALESILTAHQMGRRRKREREQEREKKDKSVVILVFSFSSFFSYLVHHQPALELWPYSALFLMMDSSHENRYKRRACTYVSMDVCKKSKSNSARRLAEYIQCTTS
jgi:hypothetical protein